MTGDEKKKQQRPHVVCFPCPSQGHINGMMQLAKLIHSKACCHITFVHTEFNYDRILSTTSTGCSSRPSTSRLDDFRFETIPDGLPADCRHTVRDSAALCVAIRTKFSSPFRKLLERLNGEECPDVPPITCVVSDSITSFTLDVSEELGVPNLFLYSASACGGMGCLHIKELMERGLVPLKSESDLANGYLDTPVDWIPGMKNIRLRDLPTFIRTTDRNETILNFLMDEFQQSFRATAIVLNTFDELEGPVLKAMSEMQLPPMYTVGPMTLLSRQLLLDSPAAAEPNIGSALWKEDPRCFEWLEGREPGSVLYLNFGSLAVLTNQQLEEFASGLANSGHDFLFVIRSDISAVLSDEFLSETRDRGLVTDWCRQEEVLMHSSVGGFLTHCGWNSVLESVSAGVPMICWPFFGDQQGNCRYLCTEWGIGAEVGEEVRREEVERVIREVMGGEKGREMRRKALEWKESAVRATGPGGSSFLNLEGVISEVILKSKHSVGN